MGGSSFIFEQTYEFVDIVLIHQYNSTRSEEIGGDGQD